MNLLRNDDTSDLEADLRALLRRRSAQVHPDQPDWQDLVERPRGVVVSMYDGDGGRGSVASPWRQRPKPVFIAAAVVAVVLAGGVAAKSATGSDSANLAESPASFSAPAPSDADFDAHSAPAVFASELADPVAATEAYLAQTGVSVTTPSTPATPGQPSLELLSNEDGIAVVEWTSVAGSVSRSGTVILRTNPVEQARSTVRATWSVVGSTVEGLVLTDVAYDGGQLSFTVTKTTDVAGPLAVGVWSDGEQVAVDGDAVRAVNADADAGASEGVVGADATADATGQLVDIGEPAGSSAALTALVDEASTAIIRVQQLVDGATLDAVAEMAVSLPGADAAAGAGVAGTGAADSDANVDAGVDDADAGASTTEGPGLGSAGDPLEGAGDAAEDVAEGGTTIPLPGDEQVTTPSLPTTLPSIPTTLPAPPSGGRMP